MIKKDRITFDIADSKVRERLLHEPELDLAKTLNICSVLEMFRAQIKTVSEVNHPMFIYSRRTISPYKISCMINHHLLQINFVILADSVVEGTRVSVRPVLRGERSVLTH